MVTETHTVSHTMTSGYILRTIKVAKQITTLLRQEHTILLRIMLVKVQSLMYRYELYNRSCF